MSKLLNEMRELAGLETPDRLKNKSDVIMEGSLSEKQRRELIRLSASFDSLSEAIWKVESLAKDLVKRGIKAGLSKKDLNDGYKLIRKQVEQIDLVADEWESEATDILIADEEDDMDEDIREAKKTPGEEAVDIMVPLLKKAGVKAKGGMEEISFSDKNYNEFNLIWNDVAGHWQVRMEGTIPVKGRDNVKGVLAAIKKAGFKI
jgi:hypothetical protein